METSRIDGVRLRKVKGRRPDHLVLLACSIAHFRQRVDLHTRAINFNLVRVHVVPATMTLAFEALGLPYPDLFI